MSAPAPSKRVKRLLGELAERAYTEALGRALSELHESFHAWQSGHISPFDVSAAIHSFHQGPNRQLYLHYTSSLGREHLVAEAMVDGLLPESAVPEEVRAYLAPWVTRLREKS